MDEIAQRLPGTIYYGIMLAAFLLCVAVYFAKARKQAAFDAVFPNDREPLGLFDLSRGNAAGALATKRLVAPERLWTYDSEYVATFAEAARPVIGLYRDEVLTLDIRFAVALGCFTALVDFAIAAALFPHVWLGNLFLASAAAGVLYAVADVAEDVTLRAILRNPVPQNVDAARTAAANMLTRIKLVSITLSVVGVAVFFILAAVPVRPPQGTGPSVRPASHRGSEPA